jgi:hypothetical protein
VPSIVHDLEIVLAIVIDFHEGIDLLADFGMTPLVGNLKDVDMVMIYLIKNLTQFFNFVGDWQFRIFGLPLEY